MAENQPENVPADDLDDEIAALVDENAANTDEPTNDEPVTDDDDDDDDEDDSDSDDVEEQPVLDLATLPDQIRDFVVNLIMVRAKDAAGTYKDAHAIVKAADDIVKTVTEQFRETSTLDWVVEARTKYDALHAEADKLRTDTEAKLRESLEQSQDVETVNKARETMKSARNDFEAQVKFANEQLLGPAGVKEDIRTVLPTLPRISGKGGATGSTGAKPRVDKIELIENGKANVVTIPVKDSKGVTHNKSSFTALRLKLNTLTGETIDVKELHKAWQDAAGQSNMANITTVVEFDWPGKNGASHKVRVTPKA